MEYSNLGAAAGMDARSRTMRQAPARIKQMAEEDAELLRARITHTIDLLRSENKSITSLMERDRELANHRLNALEADIEDFETRIREATKGITEFRLYMKIAGIGGGAGAGLGGLAMLLQILGRQ